MSDVCCPACGRDVVVRAKAGIRAADRGKMAEHFRPREGSPYPVGCWASNMTPERAYRAVLFANRDRTQDPRPTRAPGA